MFRTLFVSLLILSALTSEGFSGLTGAFYSELYSNLMPGITRNFLDLSGKAPRAKVLEREGNPFCFTHMDKNAGVSISQYRKTTPMEPAEGSSITCFSQKRTFEFIGPQVESFIKINKDIIIGQTDSSPPFCA